MFEIFESHLCFLIVLSAYSAYTTKYVFPHTCDCHVRFNECKESADGGRIKTLKVSLCSVDVFRLRDLSNKNILES